MHFIGGILIPFFTIWAGLNFTQVFILQAFFMISIFLLEIPTGVVADYFGRKHSLILACVFGIVAPIVYASMPNFWIFMVGEFLWAVSAALLSGADKALVYDSLKKIKKTELSKKIFARLKSASLLGLVIGSPIGAILAAQYGLRIPMFAMAVPAVIAVAIGFTLKEPKTVKKVESYRYWTLLKEGSTYLFKHRILRIFAFDMVTIAALAHFMIWFFQPMLMKANMSIAFFGIVHAGFVLSQVIIINSAIHLETLLKSKKRLLLIGPLILGLAYIVGGLTNNVVLILLAIIIGGGFGLSRMVLFDSYMNKYIPSNKRATVLSTGAMLQGFLMAAIYPLVGLLADWSLNYTLIGLGAVVIILALCSRVREEMLID